jgi:hypothetical protein
MNGDKTPPKHKILKPQPKPLPRLQQAGFASRVRSGGFVPLLTTLLGTDAAENRLTSQPQMEDLVSI